MIEIRYRIVHDDKYIELTKLELEKLRIEINTLLMPSTTTDQAFPPSCVSSMYPLRQITG